MTVNEIRFTPTEQRIFNKLSDGMSHRRTELLECLPDEMTSTATLQVHLSNIRRKLKTRGEDVLCVLTGKYTITYRWVRIIT